MANATVNGNIIYDLLDLAELTQYARQFYDEVFVSQFALKTWLPERKVDSLKWEAPKGGRQDVEAAEYRSWDVPAPMTGRSARARVRGTLAPISRAIPLGEEEGLNLRDIAGNPATAAQVAQVYDDVEQMIRAIAARVELARMDVLLDGKVTLDAMDNGVEGLEVDYEMPAQNKVTPSIAWLKANHATAVPISDLLALVEQQILIGSDLSRYDLVMSRTRLPDLQLNDQVRSFAQAGRATPPARVNLEELQSVFSDEGLPNIVFYDEFIRRGPDQTRSRILPPDHVLLLPRPGAGEDPFGETLFGPTAEAVLLQNRGIIAAGQAPGVIAVILQSDHPVQTVTVGAATALPTLVNPELVISMNIGS